MSEKYKSKTRGTIPIEKMNTVHIINAIKKCDKLATFDPITKKKLQAELEKRK